MSSLTIRFAQVLTAATVCGSLRAEQPLAVWMSPPLAQMKMGHIAIVE